MIIWNDVFVLGRLLLTKTDESRMSMLATDIFDEMGPESLNDPGSQLYITL
jgi:hypothetical protein